MIVPFKIIVAALLTLFVLLGRLSKEIKAMVKEPLPILWEVILAVFAGIATFFWCLSLTEVIIPITVFLGITLCTLVIIYYIGGIDFSKKDYNNTDMASDLNRFIGKEGAIVRKIDDKKDNIYLGTLFEGQDYIVVHLDEELNAKEKDEFIITRIEEDGIHAELNS